MLLTTESFRATLTAARRAGTPLICIRTADPASAQAHMIAALNGKRDKTPLIAYDFITGVSVLNEAAGTARVQLGTGPQQPVDLFAALRNTIDDAVIFFHNPQRIWNEPDILQGIWNLRDAFKPRNKMLVLITTVGVVLPAEIANDVVVFDEPLPSEHDLDVMTTNLLKSAGLPVGNIDEIDSIVDALIGLAQFPAEQALAMSITKAGVNHEALWERKRQAIEQTPGLAVWRGGETFDDVGGYDNIKAFLSAVMKGEEPPRVVVFVDEIEKAFAGSGTDMSGVKTELTGTMLSWMQDRNADGCIMIGPPGSGKSAIAKAAGASAGIPTIAFDFSAMQSGIIGSSGERLRSALSVIDAISQGRSLWLATCNSITSLPPELRRRFTMGTFFFPLPTKQERAAIWDLYLDKFALPRPNGIPNDDGWTGAEIKQCCALAHKLKITTMQASTYVVPVTKSAPEQILALQKSASGKFISASNPGMYIYSDHEENRPATRKAFTEV